MQPVVFIIIAKETTLKEYMVVKIRLFLLVLGIVTTTHLENKPLF